MASKLRHLRQLVSHLKDCFGYLLYFILFFLNCFGYFSYWKLIKLQNKSQEIEPYLNGRCIYLVGQFLCLTRSPVYLVNHLLFWYLNYTECENAGMMGSGKTTVGKILSQVIGYSFSDRFVL
jgi:hypothetical protein